MVVPSGLSLSAKGRAVCSRLVRRRGTDTATLQSWHRAVQHVQMQYLFYDVPIVRVAQSKQHM